MSLISLIVLLGVLEEDATSVVVVVVVVDDDTDDIFVSCGGVSKNNLRINRACIITTNINRKLSKKGISFVECCSVRSFGIFEFEWLLLSFQLSFG